MSDLERALRGFHSRHPGASDQVFGRCDAGDGRTSYAWVVDLVGPGTRDVLDLACGDGALAARVAERFGGAVALTGVDMSPEELHCAAARLGPAVRLLEARAQALPLADAAFDAVVSHLALMLMDPIEPVLSEIWRVLRPGGRLAAMVGGPGAPGEVQRELFQQLSALQTGPQLSWGDPRCRSSEGWSALLAGWAEVQFTEVVASVEVPAEQAWGFVERSYYPIERLDPPAKGRLETWLRHRLGGAPLRWRFGMRLISAIRP